MYHAMQYLEQCHPPFPLPKSYFFQYDLSQNYKVPYSLVSTKWLPWNLWLDDSDESGQCDMILTLWTQQERESVQGHHLPQACLQSHPQWSHQPLVSQKEFRWQWYS